jgi:multicomponent Na+:H+ antiporter subunit E
VNLTLVFLGCFGLWLVLSGHPTPLHLAQGLIASAFVAYFNRDVEAISSAMRSVPRFLGYLPWLLKEILVANVQVVRIVIDPSLPTNPVLLRVPTRLSSDLAVTTFANSITLTPGTITVDVADGALLVHSLTAQKPEAFAGMEHRVAEVFGDTVA